MIAARRLTLATAIAVLAGMSTQAQIQNKAPANPQGKAVAKTQTKTTGSAGLRWKFKEGEKLKYVYNQSTIGRMNFNGQTNEFKISRTFDMTRTIKKVLPDGSAEIAQTFDRMKFKSDTMMGEYEFDTKNPQSPVGPYATAVTAIRAVVGSEATFTMTPLGEVKNLKFAEKAAQALKGNPPGDMSMVPLTEEALKGVILESTVKLPGRPISSNGTWTDKREERDPMGESVQNLTYSFKGPEPKNKALDRIDLESSIDFKPNSSTHVNVNIKHQEIKGTIGFDREAGHVADFKSVMKLRANVGNQGQGPGSEMSKTTSITLGESSAPTLAKAKPHVPVPGALYWKFKEGDKVAYVLEKRVVTKTSQKIELTILWTYDVTRTVKKLLSDGSAEMALTFDRIRFDSSGKFQNKPLESVVFDSKDAKDPEGPVAVLGAVLRTLVGNDATFTITPLGEISDLKLPEKAVDALKDSPQPRGTQSPLNEDHFKEVITESTLVLPGKKLAANETWTEKKQSETPQGPISEKMSYTFKGPNAKHETWDHVDVKIAANSGSGLFRPQVQGFKGSIDFDRKLGHIAAATSNRKSKVSLGTVEAEFETTITVSLPGAPSK